MVFDRILKDSIIQQLKDMLHVLENFNSSSLLFGVNPLHQAVFTGDLKTVEFLLDHFNDTNQRDSEGNTLAHLAAMRGCVDFEIYLDNRQHLTIS